MTRPLRCAGGGAGKKEGRVGGLMWGGGEILGRVFICTQHLADDQYF